MPSVLDYDKREVAERIRAQRARSLALLEDVDEAGWEREITPGWRLREVAAHLVSADEAALTGRMLALGTRQVPVSELEAWNDVQVRRWADRPVPAILDGLDRWGRRIARLLAATPSAVLRRRLPMPFGRVSLLWLGMMRVYDEWIHLEDVRRTFEFPADDSPEAVAPVARHLQAGIPFQTLPRVPEGAKGTVALSFSDVELPALVVDLERRRYWLGGGDAEARISGRAATLVMIAARRDTWRDAEEDGGIAAEGDRAAAETFLDALLLV